MARMRGGSVAPRPARRARSFACGPTDGTDRSPPSDRERSDNRPPHPSAGTLPPGCRRKPASLRPSVHRPPIDRCTKQPSAVHRRSRRTSIDRPSAAARNVPRPSFGGRAARPAAASRSPASPGPAANRALPFSLPHAPSHTPYGPHALRPTRPTEGRAGCTSGRASPMPVQRRRIGPTPKDVARQRTTQASSAPLVTGAQPQRHGSGPPKTAPSQSTSPRLSRARPRLRASAASSPRPRSASRRRRPWTRSHGRCAVRARRAGPRSAGRSRSSGRARR